MVKVSVEIEPTQTHKHFSVLSGYSTKGVVVFVCELIREREERKNIKVIMINKSLLGAINSFLFIYKLNLKLSPSKGKLPCCVQTFSAIICWKSHPQVRLFIEPHQLCYDRPVYCFRRHFWGNSNLQNKAKHNDIKLKQKL